MNIQLSIISGTMCLFEPFTDVTGVRWNNISDDDRGKFRPVFEIAYNHYVTRKGLEMPYTQQVISRISPEGDAMWCDHPGYGTITVPYGIGYAAERRSY